MQFPCNFNSEPIEQYSVGFYHNLIARTDFAIDKLGLDEKQVEYIFEKNTNFNDDIRIELTDKAIDYFEDHRKETNHGMLQIRNHEIVGYNAIIDLEAVLS